MQYHKNGKFSGGIIAITRYVGGGRKKNKMLNAENTALKAIESALTLENNALKSLY